jgi:hypothetical protein
MLRNESQKLNGSFRSETKVRGEVFFMFRLTAVAKCGGTTRLEVVLTGRRAKESVGISAALHWLASSCHDRMRGTP